MNSPETLAEFNLHSQGMKAKVVHSNIRGIRTDFYCKGSSAPAFFISESLSLREAALVAEGYTIAMRPFDTPVDSPEDL